MSGHFLQYAATKPPKHLPQLDALRAFAVLAVVLDHSLPPTSIFAKLGVGFLGVRLFFVLSGFLITGILLRARLEAETRGLSKGQVLKAFYIRRVLRIFPAYYLLLLVCSLLGLQILLKTFAWHFFYLTNYYLAFTGQWLDPISHFWSLGVEEQFYAFWPLLVLFVPLQRFGTLLALTIALSPALRFVLATLYKNGITAKSPGFSCMDMLGLGAALAYIHLSRGESSQAVRRFTHICLASGLALLLATFALKGSGTSWSVRVATLDLSVALIFTWCVDAASRGISGPMLTIFEWKPLLYLGKISYGVYLFHCLTPWLSERAIQRFGFPNLLPAPGYARFAYMVAVSIALAALSWRFLEQPLNRLKDRFPYLPPVEQPQNGTTFSPSIA